MRHMLFLLLLASLAGPALPQVKVVSLDRHPQRSHDLRVTDQARMIVVERHESLVGSIFVSGEGEDSSFQIDHKGDATWIDEVGARGGAAVHHRRTFLDFRNTENGRIADPGLEGVCLTIAVVGEEANVEPKAPRQIGLSAKTKNKRAAAAVGLFAELPESATVGTTFPLVSEGLFCLLLDLDTSVSDLKSELTFERVDDTTGHGFLSGPAKLSTRINRTGVTATARYDGTLAVEIDLVTHVILNVRFAGASKLEGCGALEGKLSGAAKFESTLTGKPVTSLTEYKDKIRRPVFRENTHRLLGAEFKLPSCWVLSPPKDPSAKVFIDSRSEDGAAIEAIRLDKAVDPSADPFIEGFLKSARKEAPDVKTKKTTFATGDGFTFEFTTPARDRGRGFVAPVAKGIIRLRLIGSPDAYKKAEGDFKALQASLAESQP